MKKYILIIPILLTILACNNTKKTGININYDNFKFQKNFLEASKQRMLGNDQEAVNLYMTCLSINKESAASNYLLSSIYLKKNDIQTAQTFAGNAVSIEKNNIWYDLQLAETYIAGKKYPEAEIIYSGLKKKYPNKRFIYEELINLNKMLDKTEKIIILYEELKNNFGINQDESLVLFDLYMSFDEFEKAKELLNELTAEYPFNIDYQLLYADYYIANNNLLQAQTVFDNLAEKYPNSGKLHLSLAAFYKLKNDKNNFLNSIKKAFQSSDIELNRKISIFLQDIVYNFTEAEIESLLKIIENEYPENYQIYILYAEHYLQKANKLKAIKYFRNAYKISTSSLKSMKKLLELELSMFNYSNLYHEAKKLTEIYPNQAEIYFYAGLSAYRLGKYDESVKYLSAGKELVVDNVKLKIDFLTFLAQAHDKQKKYKKADEIFDNLLNKYPENYFIKNTYAFTLAQSNRRLNFAEELVKKCLLVNSISPFFNDTYARILLMKGEYQKALETIQISIEKMPDNPQILERYGDILFKLNKIEEAVKYWKQAKLKGSSSILLEEKIKNKTY